MKKYIIIALIALVGGAMIYSVFFNKNAVIEPVEKHLAAVFAFEENLATIGEEVVPVTINIKEKIKHIDVTYNDSVISSWNNINADVKFDFKAGMFGVGTRTLGLIATLEDGREFIDTRFVRVLSDIVPEKLSTSIVKSFPHNPSSFTQGLEFYKGQLFEGTGDPGDQGATIVAEVDLESGDHIRKMGLDVGYFGEGITLLNDKLYQLTYKNGKCYTYDVSTLQINGEYTYSGEGWGLCNDGSSLIMSNGTERITFRDPENFSTVRVIEVYNNKGPIINLNELEYIDGLIYANVWTTNMVVVIDPKSGKVLKEIDATNLMREGRGNGEVLNGIAHNPTTGKTYMTGKYWFKLFEVKFDAISDLP